MRCFTVDLRQPGYLECIQVAGHPFPHVLVGERGRGREYSILPLAPRFSEAVMASANRGGPVVVSRASLYRSRTGRIFLAEDRPGDESLALVLLRGGVSYHGGMVRVPCSRRGRMMDWEETCPQCGAPSQWTDMFPGGARVHPPDEGFQPSFSPPEAAPGVTVLLRGEEGRNPRREASLLIMEPGSKILARMGQGLLAPVVRVEYTGSGVRVSELANEG